MKTLLAIALATISVACNTTNSQQISNKESKQVAISFNADSAYKYIEQQVNFGPRVPGTESHKQCLEYLVSTLQQFGAEVNIQEGEGIDFYGKPIALRNVVAHILPQKANRIILCSHWDCRPFADNDSDVSRINEPIDGANDGASGVGVIMEIARQLQIQKPNIGVDIIFFDVEDYGKPDHINVANRPDTWCLGSQYWGKSEEGQQSEARFGILLDMVGAPGAQFFKEGFSMSNASGIVEKVWRAAAEIGYGNRFVNDDGGFITDDHYYINSLTKVPCIDIIHLDVTNGMGFGSYWHTHDDTMKNIDKSTLVAVGETLLSVIYNER